MTIDLCRHTPIKRLSHPWLKDLEKEGGSIPLIVKPAEPKKPF